MEFGEGGLMPNSWSPNGQYIVFSNGPKGSVPATPPQDLWLLPTAGDRTPRPLLKTAASEFHGRVSPDGRWFAYTSNESGRQEVYVAPFPDGGGKTLISTAGGNQPRWRRDGAELFYMSLDAKIMSASVNGRGTGFSVGEVRTLFDVRLRAGQRSQLDVAPDGQRFLVIISTDQRQAAPPITIITNWIAGLPPAK